MWFWFISGMFAGLIISIPPAMLLIRLAARRVRMYEQQSQADERLEELGTLTGGLAHEIKNPISTIGLNLQLLEESIRDLQLPETDAGRLTRRIHSAVEEADRLRNILEDFLRFAGRIKLHMEPADLNRIVQELADFYQPQAEASDIRMREQLTAELPTVSLDISMFKQALLNLLINATQAMVDARYNPPNHGGAHDLMIQTELGDQEVYVHVIDTGPGIGPEQQAKIFMPYFTTKRGGSGLGLAITRRIIQEHGGDIILHSEPGKGSDFRIVLPIPSQDDHTNAPAGNANA